MPGDRMITKSTSAYTTGIAVMTALVAAAFVVYPALAQSSLGIGVSEATPPSTGLFSGTMAWIAAQQQDFYRTLTSALRSMRDGGDGMWLLVGISFAYGVFHAAGPGHGKAVISSYMLANEVALRRGVLLSFLSSAMQGLTALVLMGAVFFFLHGAAVSMTDATLFLERASYALVAAFGAWLLWRKVGRDLFMGRTAHSLSAAHHDHHGDHSHHHHDNHDHHGHDHGPGEVCASCGHSHAPDPRLISGERFDWRTAWTAIMAVGLRPCTGAIVVLSFAFLNGLWAGGILSVAAMSLGTAITVSTLAILAVTAKNWAVMIAGDGRLGNRIHNGVEIAGALMVFLLGVLLLSASLQ